MRGFLKNMRFSQIIFVVATIWYAFTAFFSTGYYHGDEHYQLIEFAEYLDGSNSAEILTWDFHDQIRPTLQPTICHAIFRVSAFFGIADPHQKAFILRLLTALLSALAIYFFTNSCKSWVAAKNWKWFVVLSYFLWFLPAINVRFSSEAWSGIAFLVGLSLVMRNNRNHLTYLSIGCFLGLSFLFRYQMAFAIVGILLWLVIIRKESFLRIALVMAAGLVMVGIGALIDRWFYGEWTLTLWNYFRVNLVEGKAAEFGSSPWYYYFFLIFRRSFFPIGIVILGSFLVLILRKKQNVLIWAILPFLLGHTLIAHKELRFLFPIANLVPLVMVLAFQEFQRQKHSFLVRKAIAAIAVVLILINGIGLTVASMKPAGVGWARITEKIDKMASPKPLNVFFTTGNNPYAPHGAPPNFYTTPNLTFINMDTITTPLSVTSEDEIQVLVIRASEAEKEEIQAFISRMNLNEKYQSVPEFLLPLLKVYGYRTNDIAEVYSNE